MRLSFSLFSSLAAFALMAQAHGAAPSSAREVHLVKAKAFSNVHFFDIAKTYRFKAEDGSQVEAICTRSVIGIGGPSLIITIGVDNIMPAAATNIESFDACNAEIQNLNAKVMNGEAPVMRLTKPTENIFRTVEFSQ